MIRIGDRPHAASSATLELYHLFAAEAGWNLDVTLAGPGGRDAGQLALEGRVRTPALPGPSALIVWYVDAPGVVTLDGEHGTLAAPDDRPALTCTALGEGRVHLAGTLALAWAPMSGGPTRPFAIALDLDADLVT